MESVSMVEFHDISVGDKKPRLGRTFFRRHQLDVLESLFQKTRCQVSNLYFCRNALAKRIVYDNKYIYLTDPV